MRARQRVRYQRDKDSVKARQAIYYKANRERCVENARRWERENSERAIELKNARRRNRYAKQRAAGGEHRPEDVAAILKAQRGRCAYCRKRLIRYDVDHIQPIARGGANDRTNLQALCRPCNQAKHAQDPIVFAQSIGLLL